MNQHQVDDKTAGYKRAIYNIRRKLALAGIRPDPSVMRMVEDAKVELIRLRAEKTALWDYLKDYARDRLKYERAVVQAMMTVLPEEWSEAVLDALEKEGY